MGQPLGPAVTPDLNRRDVVAHAGPRRHSSAERDRPILLFLGVDGTLNAHLAAEEWGRQTTFPVRIPGRDGEQREVEITVAPRLISTLRELLEQFGVRLCWLTRWLDEDALSPLLPELPGASLPPGEQVALPPREPTGFRPLGWKLDALVAHVRAHPGSLAVIWADDELGRRTTAALAGRLPDTPVLAVGTDPDYGLSPDHIVEMGKFCDAIRSGDGQPDGRSQPRDSAEGSTS